MFYDESIFSGTQPFNYSDLEVTRLAATHNKSVKVSLSNQIINNVNILTPPSF